VGYYDQICFKGSIDKKNGKVIYFVIEGQNQQNVAEKSSRNDTATKYTTGDRENGQ